MQKRREKIDPPNSLVGQLAPFTKVVPENWGVGREWEGMFKE